MNLLLYVHLRNIYGSTGTGRVARQITEQFLRASEDQVHILADRADHARVIPRVGSPWDGLRYHFFSGETSWQELRWLLTGTPRAEQYCPETEIVYCTNESYVPTRKARLIVTLHDAAVLESGVLPNTWRMRKQGFRKRLLGRALTRTADLIHTVSWFSAERLAHFFPDLRSRLRVVHNGVSPRFQQPVSPEGREWLRRQCLESARFVLLPGGLNYRKNADLVLRAWEDIRKRHPTIWLVVAGHCEPQYTRPAAALGSSVRVTGFVDDEALRCLYDAAQIVWFPSLYEGFGLPVVEAMACGAPVVASRSAAIPEVAGDAAFLVEPTSTAGHIEALDTLLVNPRERESLRQRGRIRARQFTWEAAVSKLRAEFASLL